MHKLLYVFLISSAVFTFANTDITPAQQCEGENFADLQERIQVLPCGSKGYCELTKEHNTTVFFKFKAAKDIETLENEVFAEIGPMQLPFIGVTGASACGHILHAEDGTPANCPLKAGVEYIYTKVFPILEIYPETSLKVQWSLKDGKNKVICFVVPAKIVKNKKKKSH